MKSVRLVCLLLALLFSFCLFSCRKNDRFDPCPDGHELTYYAQIDPTCKTEGRAVYSECSRCHKRFDADGKRVSLEDLILPATCHPDGVWIFDESEHYQTCTLCGEPTLAQNHRFEEGVCSVCGALKEEVSCRHRGGKATCQEKAVCELCGKTYGKLGGHEKVFRVSNNLLDGEATCTRRASYHASCALCEFVYAETFTVGAPLGHTGDATCVRAGICTRCNQSYGPTDAHDFSLQAANESTLAEPATCIGGAKYYTACADCGKLGTATFVFGAPDPEAHEFVTDTAATDQNRHTLICRLCNAVSVGSHTADRPGSCLDFVVCLECGSPCPAAPHDFSAMFALPEYLAAPATKTSPATYYYSCVFCGASGTATFPYGENGGE